MNIEGAEIPAWGMFALAVVYIAFQFILKWQERTAKRNSKPPAQMVEVTQQLASITGALAGIATVLAQLTQEVGELHQIHLGPKALDDDNRPKWWSDRRLVERIAKAVEEMNHRIARLELRRVSSKDSVSGLPRQALDKK